MNTLRGIYTIWYRDILRFWHDRMRMMGAIVFPLLFLVVFGAGLSPRIGGLGPGVSFTQFIFPGVVGMTVLMTSFMAGVSVVWDREFGFLKEVLVAPISRASVALGKTSGAATIAIIQGLLILVFAPLAGAGVSLLTILQLIPVMLLLAVAMGALGILLATRIRSMEAFQVVTQMLMFPMILLSGVFFPLEGLPGWMNAIVKVNPATYGIAPIRQVMLADSPGPGFTINVLGHDMSIWDNLLVLAAFAALMLLLAIWSFEHQD